MAAYGKSKYRMEGPWDQVRQQLSQLQGSDDHAETQISRGNRVALGGCLLVLLAGLALFASFDAIATPLGFSGFCLLMGGLVYHALFSTYDLENMRYELPLRFLDTIAIDLDPTRPVSLMIDFRASQSRPFVVNVEQSGFLFFQFGPKVTYFDHLWLELSATSADGYRMKLQVRRQGSFKEVPKRKRTKTRLRYCDVVQASVRPPQGQVSTGVAQVAPPLGNRFVSFRGQMTPQGAVVKATGPSHWTVCNRGTSHGGEHLRGGDLSLLMMSCFRALLSVAPGARP